MAKQTKLTGGLLVTAIVCVALVVTGLLNVVSSGLFARLDLTENNLNTLSDASRDAAANLDDVEVRLYVSPDLPEVLQEADANERVSRHVVQKFQDIIREYESHSNGQMKIQVVADDMVEKGRKAKLHVFSGEEATAKDGMIQFKEYVLGATFHYKDAMEVLPYAGYPRHYEFEITRILLRLKEKVTHSVMMKDVLSAGADVSAAVAECDLLLGKAEPEEDEPSNPFGLLTADAAKARVEAYRSASATLDPACGAVAETLSKTSAMGGKQPNLDNIRALAEAYVKGWTQFRSGLDAEDEQAAAGALQMSGQLKAIAAETAAEQQALVDSPGRKQIGIVCAGGGFCPFPDTAPLIPKELEAVLAQKNPIIPQLLPQLQQIQDQMNRFLAGIERDLFRRRGFHIVKVDLNETIPEDVAGLVLMGPRSALSDWQLYSLDQFVLGGGSLVVLLNAWDVSIMNLDAKQQPRHTQLAKNSANVDQLLTHWGIKPNGDLVVEPQDHDRVLVESPVRTPFGMATSRRNFPYPLVPVLHDMDRESPLVRAVSSITLPYATSLTLSEDGDQEVRALVKSSAASSTTGDASFPLEPQAQVAAVSKATGDGPHVVAAMARGKLTSYFAGKEAPEAPSKEEAKEGEDTPDTPDTKRLESGEGRVLVIGSNLGLEVLSKEVIFEGFDLGSLTNGSFDAVSQAPQWGANWQNWWTRIRQVGHTLQSNVPLLDNVLDWSIQNEGLMEVRAKNIQFRPLAQLDEDQQGWVTATGVVAAPILFLLFGLMRLGSRRRRRQRLGGTTN